MRRKCAGQARPASTPLQAALRCAWRQAHPQRGAWAQTMAAREAGTAAAKVQRAAKHSDAVVTALADVRANEYARMHLTTKQQVHSLPTRPT